LMWLMRWPVSCALRNVRGSSRDFWCNAVGHNIYYKSEVYLLCLCVLLAVRIILYTTKAKDMDPMKIKAPLVEAVMQHARQNITPFHMPGHKGGRGFPEEFLNNLAVIDVTEIPGMDNLHQPAGVIAQAQQMASAAYRSHRSFFLVNGSTSGIHAMIMAVCKPGDRLLVPRNSHKSVWSALVMADVRPVYIQPQYDIDNLLTTQISVQQVCEALDRYPDAVGLLVTHPNYYGMCSHIEEIEKLVHDRGKLLLVDEAHGAHFIFHSALPPSSGEIGADIWVQSAHKTLPALTQGAYLHVGSSKMDWKRLAQVLGMIQTSSPSYMVMASLDWARAFMEARGKDLLQQLIIRIENLKKLLKSEYGLLSLDDYGGWKEVAAVDPTRLTLDVRSLGITGYQAELLLREAGVQVEMSDMYRLVSIFSVADKEMEFEAFIRGCDYLSKNISLRKDLSSLGFNQLSISREIPEQIMSPREAFYSIIENVPMRESIGRVCAGIIGTYPPGIPRFCPGELIDREGIEELDDIQQRGGNLFGLVDNLLVPVVKV